jgi:hypothetical protein
MPETRDLVLKSTSLNCTVVSIVPFEINENKPGLIPPRFHLDASKDGIPETLNVTTCYHHVYLDDTRGSLRVPNPADLVANSIVLDFVTSQLAIDEDCQPGLFWVPGRVENEQLLSVYKTLLKEMNFKQNNWFHAICRMADNDWNRYHQHNVISDFQRKAAHLLNWRPEDHPWMNNRSMENASSCPACGTLNQANNVICSGCRFVLNPERFKEMQFA